MITETTEYTVDETRGWIFYDAKCPVCQRGMKFWSTPFIRRGFRWLPLQTPGTAERLCISQAALLEDMKVLCADGRLFGGVDAWVVLGRSIWWLWPLALMFALPGLHAFAAVCYRWIARRRYCLGSRRAAFMEPQS